MSNADPNWLNVVGLIYAGVGVAIVATAVAASATRTAGTSELPRRQPSGAWNASFGALGGVMALAGFVLQSMAQFMVLGRGSTVALMLIGLMAVLGLYGIAVLARTAAATEADVSGGASGVGEFARTVVEAVMPAPSNEAAQESPAAAPVAAAVKLVSSG